MSWLCCSCCRRRDGDEEQSSKTRPCIVFLRTFIFSVCTLFFAGHAFMLIQHFLSNPTRMTARINASDTVDIPGITVCFPTKFDNKISTANEVFKINFGSAGSIKCNLMKMPLSREQHDLAYTPSQMSCEDIAMPVESINYGYGQKCKTYFSRQKGKNSMDFIVPKENLLIGGNGGDIVDLEIEFPTYPVENFQDSGLAGLETRSALLMVHSPYEMPDWTEKVSKIKPAMEYVISFNKITEMRAQPPFKTSECSTYEDNAADISMRSRYDCIDMCLLNLFRHNCRCLPANLNVRKEMLYSGDRFCEDKRCFSLASVEAKACKTLPQCKPNCIKETYEFTSEVTPIMAPNIFYGTTRPIVTQVRPQTGPRPQMLNSDVNTLVSNAAKAYITLRKSSHPDFIYEHMPEKDKKEFAFQLVTLASVWLGVSVFRFIWRPIWFFSRCVARCLCCGC